MEVANFMGGKWTGGLVRGAVVGREGADVRMVRACEPHRAIPASGNMDDKE